MRAAFLWARLSPGISERNGGGGHVINIYCVYMIKMMFLHFYKIIVSIWNG